MRFERVFVFNPYCPPFLAFHDKKGDRRNGWWGYDFLEKAFGTFSAFFTK